MATSPSAISPRDREILAALAQRIEPADAAGHNNLGVLYFNKGMIPEAAEQFQRAADIDPGMQVALRNLEIVYLSTGYGEAQVQALTTRLREYPEDREARWQLVQVCRHTGRLDEAASELRRLLAASPSNLRLLLELGRTEKEAGRFGEAMQAYERARRVDPRSAVLHFQLGELHYHRGNSEQARRALQLATELEPAFGEAWHLLSFVLGDLGDPAAATEALERAQRIRPELRELDRGLSIDRNSPARYGELVGQRQTRPLTVRDRYLGHYNLGIAFRQQGLYEEALREFERSLEEGEEEVLARQASAEVHLVAGRSGAATELYRALLEVHPQSPKLWNELGVAVHRLGDLDEAERCYRTAVQIDPKYALAWNNLGVAAVDRGDTALAREAFDRALAKDDSFSEPLCNLGLLALSEGHRREALRWYRRSVEGDPQTAVGWSGVGAVLGEAGQLEEARHALARAIEIDPKSAESRYRLAFVLNRLGDREGSLRETRQALTIDPYFTAPRYRLAIELQFEYAEVLAPVLSTETVLGADQGVSDFTPSAEELSGIFGQLRRQAPEPAASAAPAYGLAEDYLSKGMLGKALAEIRRVALAGGDAVEAALLGGEVFLRQRLEGEALERFDAALARLGDTGWSDRHERAWLGRGWSLLALGKGDQAAEAAETVRGRNPDALDAQRLNGEAMLQLDRSLEAVSIFRTLVERTPNDAGGLMRLGASARAAEQFDLARDAYERALAVDADLLAARVELGRLLLDQADMAGAAEHARVALEALPGYAEASMLLADAEHARGDSRTAVRVLVELLEEDLYHLPGLQRLGEILLEAGAATDAVTAFQRVLRFDPGSAAAWHRLADALERVGEMEESAECRRRAEQIEAEGGERAEAPRWVAAAGVGGGAARSMA